MFNQALKKDKESKSEENNFKQIIYAYKKLKQIAKYESGLKSDLSFKIANLNQDQLEKIKLLEGKIGFKLVAYENSDLNYRKNEILEGIHILLDEYLSLYENKTFAKSSTKKIIPINNKKEEKINEDFNGFFQ